MRIDKSTLESMKKIYPKKEWGKYKKYIKDNNIKCRVCGNFITVEEWLSQYFEKDNLKDYICDNCWGKEGVLNSRINEDGILL